MASKLTLTNAVSIFRMYQLGGAPFDVEPKQELVAISYGKFINGKSLDQLSTGKLIGMANTVIKNSYEMVAKYGSSKDAELAAKKLQEFNCKRQNTLKSASDSGDKHSAQPITSLSDLSYSDLIRWANATNPQSDPIISNDIEIARNELARRNGTTYTPPEKPATQDEHYSTSSLTQIPKEELEQWANAYDDDEEENPHVSVDREIAIKELRRRESKRDSIDDCFTED